MLLGALWSDPIVPDRSDARPSIAPTPTRRASQKTPMRLVELSPTYPAYRRASERADAGRPAIVRGGDGAGQRKKLVASSVQPADGLGWEDDGRGSMGPTPPRPVWIAHDMLGKGQMAFERPRRLIGPLVSIQAGFTWADIP